MDNNPATIWFWLLLASFGLSVILFFPFVVLTYTQRRNKEKWKAFWNVMEIVWLVGGSLGVITALSSSWQLTKSFIDDNTVSAMQRTIKDLGDQATTLIGFYCPDGSVDNVAFCDVLHRIAAAPMLTKDDVLSRRQFAVSKEEFYRAYKTLADPRGTSMLGSEIGRLEELGEHIRTNNPPEFPLPSWLPLLRAFGPQVFAFVFGIRICRAIAAFRL